MARSFLPPIVATLLADTGEFSASMDEAQGQMAELGVEGEATGAKLGAVWGKMATVIAGAGLAVIGISLDMAYKYSEALDAMQRQTDLTDKQMAMLKNQILNVSTQTATSAETITEGYTQAIKAGLSLSQAHVAVAQAAKFANAEEGDLSDTLTAALAIQKLHISGTKNVSNTLDIFTTAIQHSELTADTLTQALSGRALSAFAAYHVDLKTAVTALAGFSAQNLVGTKATMALKTGIAALEAPSRSTTGTITQAAKTLGELGLNQQALAEEIRRPEGLLNVLNQINRAFNENASAQMKAQGIAAIMQQIFGTSAGPAFTNLITQLPKLMDLYNQLSSSRGATNSAFAKWLASPAGAFEKFKTVLENSAIRLGDVLLPKLTVGVIDATRLITAIESSPTAAHTVEDIAAGLFGGALVTKLLSGLGRAGTSIFGDAGDGFGAAASSELLAGASGYGLIAGATLAAFMASHPPQYDFSKTKAEWDKNKVGGTYDVVALTANTLTGWFNDVIDKLPGHPALPSLPIVGPKATPPSKSQLEKINKETQVPGFMGDYAFPKVTVNHKATLVVRKG